VTVSPTIPSPIDFSGRVTQLANHSFLDDAGHFYTTLRPPFSLSWAPAPERIEGLPPLNWVTVGGVQDYYAVLGITAGGEAYGLGTREILGVSTDPPAPEVGPFRIPHWDGCLNAFYTREANRAGIYGTMANGKVAYTGWLFKNSLGTNPGPSNIIYSPPSEVGGITHIVGFLGPETGYYGYVLDQFGRVFKWDIEGYLAESVPISPIPELSHYDIAGLGRAHLVGNSIMLFTSDFRGISYGNNLRGVSGVGAEQLKTRPVELPALKGARPLSIGETKQGFATPGSATCAVMADGLMRVWGESYTFFSEFEIHSNTIFPTPAGRNIRESGYAGRVLVMEDGTLWYARWPLPAEQNYWEVTVPGPVLGFTAGVSGFGSSHEPRIILMDGSRGYLTFDGQFFVAAQDDFIGTTGGLALKSDGTVWAWSNNGFNTQVPGLSGIAQIARSAQDARYSSPAIALRNDGRVFVWGSLPSGSLLGDGLIHPALTTPVMLEGLTSIVQIGCGWDFLVALRADGEVFIWGNNYNGQLGVGDRNRHLFMEHPYGLASVVQIWTGGDITIAKRSDGTFWGWGANSSGELPDGSAVVLGAPNLAYGYSGTVFNAGNGFQDWLTTHFNEQELRNIELFADVKDPDDDGLVNLLEYGLGTNPRKRTIPVTITAGEPLPPATPTTEFTTYVPTVRVEKVRRNYYSNGVGIAGAGGQDEETSHLVMTVPRAERRSDVDYIVEVSDDLEHWHFGPGHTVEVMNTLTNLVVYDARPVEPGRKRFIRLRLVRNNPGQTSIPR
jgi:hypothetical protein